MPNRPKWPFPSPSTPAAGAVQPAFLLMPVSARDDLRAYLTQGGRKIETWAARHRLVEVPFQDAAAFANINTLDDLRAFEAP